MTKIFQNKFCSEERAKNWVLLIGLFVVLPAALYFLSQSLIETFGKGGCLISTGGLVWLHLGLPLMIILQRAIPWKISIIIMILFAILIVVLAQDAAKNYISNNNFDHFAILILYNAYNSLYLFGIKGLFEAWKRRKTKSFWWAIFLASPLLMVIFLTIIVGFFFLANCFNH